MYRNQNHKNQERGVAQDEHRKPQNNKQGSSLTLMHVTWIYDVHL